MCPDIHRHPDGSLDLDFYRRKARRQRSRAKRMLFKQRLQHVAETARLLRALFALLAKRLSDRDAAPPTRPFSVSHAKPMR